MRDFFDIGMAFPALDISVNGMIIKVFRNIVIDSFAILINPPQELIFVAQDAIVFVSRFCIKAY